MRLVPDKWPNGGREWRWKWKVEVVVVVVASISLRRLSYLLRKCERIICQKWTLLLRVGKATCRRGANKYRCVRGPAACAARLQARRSRVTASLVSHGVLARSVHRLRCRVSYVNSAYVRAGMRRRTCAPACAAASGRARRRALRSHTQTLARMPSLRRQRGAPHRPAAARRASRHGETEKVVPRCLRPARRVRCDDGACGGRAGRAGGAPAVGAGSSVNSSVVPLIAS